MSRTWWPSPRPVSRSRLYPSRFHPLTGPTGSYTVQIWWKGDPGVENFMIKFQNEDMMKKWAVGLDQQRKENAPQLQKSPDEHPVNFTWIMGQGLENPYAEQPE